MVRRALPVIVVAAAILVAGLVLLDEGSAQTRNTRPGSPVEVANFPELQAVEVPGTPSQATLVPFENQLVSANGSRDPASWRRVGSLATDGFGWVVLSLGGELQGVVSEPAAVAAILVPEQGPVLRALKEDGVLLFPLQATATVVPGRQYFTSQPERLPVGFRRYQVYLYNTSGQTVQAHLYAYLGN